MIYIGSDHRGFSLKNLLKDHMEKKKILFEDVGPKQLDLNDDYVDFAELVARNVSKDYENEKGVLVCGSGHGMDMVANKYKNLRAALCFNVNVAIQSREHENSNILILASDWLKPNEAIKIFDSWLGASFSGGARHLRRIKKIEQLEKTNFKY